MISKVETYCSCLSSSINVQLSKRKKKDTIFIILKTNSGLDPVKCTIIKKVNLSSIINIKL